MSSKRTVKRVLVMLDYGPEDPASGEVFDLTALVQELRKRNNQYWVYLNLQVIAKKQWTATGTQAAGSEMTVEWGGDLGGEWVHGATHLDDVINAGLPDGDRVKDLKAKAKRLIKRAEEITRDAQVAKLQQAAGVRHQYPIARVTETAPALPSIPAVNP